MLQSALSARDVHFERFPGLNRTSAGSGTYRTEREWHGSKTRTATCSRSQRSTRKFVVSDTGQGIPSDKLESVFVRFLQVVKNDPRSVGLGLYISKCIVQGHGGHIWAASTLGEGSSFTFTLPLSLAA